MTSAPPSISRQIQIMWSSAHHMNGAATEKATQPTTEKRVSVSTLSRRPTTYATWAFPKVRLLNQGSGPRRFIGNLEFLLQNALIRQLWALERRNSA
jgi:hypothetical protein